MQHIGSQPYRNVLDINLGRGINGVTLQERIKAISPMIINVAVSGNFGGFDLMYLRANGFDDMLHKPVPLECLKNMYNYYTIVHDRWMTII